MAIEIVDFPINSMVIFQFAMLVYQTVINKNAARKKLGIFFRTVVVEYVWPDFF